MDTDLLSVPGELCGLSAAPMSMGAVIRLAEVRPACGFLASNRHTKVGRESHKGAAPGWPKP